jgi:hypothetical protein
MTETDPGNAIAHLVLDSQRWMHRRVDTLRMDEHGRTRLSVSIDLTVPEGPGGSERSVLVPLALVGKGTLTSLSTRGPTGNPMPVLGADDNARVSQLMLTALARRLMPAAVARSDRLSEKFWGVVQSDVLVARHWFRRYVVWREQAQIPYSGGLDVFEGLLRTLRGHFLLLVELDADLVGRRVVVKYSHETHEPDAEGRTTRLPASFTMPFGQVGWARSWHLEVHAPPGTAIVALEAQQTDASGAAATPPAGAPGGVHGDGARAAVAADSAPGLAHVAVRPGSRVTDAVVRFALTPQRTGLRGTSLWGAWLATAALIVAALGRWTDLDVLASPLTDSAPVSILLTGPALLLSWISRAPEHPLAARLLRPVRRALAISAGSLLALALVVAVPLAPPLEDARLATAVVVQGTTTVRLSRLWWRVGVQRRIGGATEVEP